MNISEYLSANLTSSIRESIARLDEAIMSKDFDKAAKILRSIVSKNGHGSAMHPFGVDTNGNKCTALIAVDKNYKRLVAVLFTEEGSSVGASSLMVIDGEKQVMGFLGDAASNDNRHAYPADIYEIPGLNTLKVMQAVNAILDGDDAVGVVTKLNAEMGLNESEDAEDPVLEGYAEDMADIENILASKKTIKGKLGILKYWREIAVRRKDTANLDIIDSKINELGGLDGATVQATGASQVVAQKTTVRVAPIKISDQKAFEESILGHYGAREKMQDMKDTVEVMTKRNNPNVGVFAGAPGIGKTFNVTEILKKHRGQEGVQLAGAPGWKLIKGDVSPVALYKLLLEWRGLGNILVFDDCDNVIRDKVAVNLLKGACDSGRRVIGWNKGVTPQIDGDLYAELMEDLLSVYKNEEAIPRGYAPEVKSTPRGDFYFAPKNFDFSANVIILTNMSLKDIPSALKNRGAVMDLDFTETEKIELIQDVKRLVKSENATIDLTDEIRDRAFDYVTEFACSVDAARENGMSVKGEVSIRTFVGVCEQLAMFDFLSEAEQKRKAMKYMLGQNSNSGSHE